MTSTALIVIDMQNAFLHPQGENAYPDAAAVIGPVTQLIEAARRSERLIVFTLDRHRAGVPDFEQPKLPVHGVQGTMDADYFSGFGPRQGAAREIEIVKRRYSAFFATELGILLHEHRIERVVICGVKTNNCVRATAQDAFAWGFEVVVPRQATNSNRPYLAAASLEDIDRYMGSVVDLGDALSMLAGTA
ncbi:MULTISPECIES: isochorismatase family cysteine hydrolase [unclassified Roseitalea]|uniref:cysteine hydrolase family protein n=1 Tax=unclassified Roseitalea TaxID=2639107 RepID=UPI00273F40C5|nr:MULTISPECIES: isochorismatase family cysteine hydrolase [unclassified Roseitalea]